MQLAATCQAVRWPPKSIKATEQSMEPYHNDLQDLQDAAILAFFAAQNRNGIRHGLHQHLVARVKLSRRALEETQAAIALNELQQVQAPRRELQERLLADLACLRTAAHCLAIGVLVPLYICSAALHASRSWHVGRLHLQLWHITWG